MSDNQIKAVILFSLAGGFIKLYNGHVTKIASKVQRIMKRSLRKVAESNMQEYVNMVATIDSQWQSVLGTVEERLEIMNLVSFILSYEPEVSNRFGISDKLIEKFSSVPDDDVLLQVELKSKLVAQELIDGVYESYGLSHPKRANLRKITLEIEGKSQ